MQSTLQAWDYVCIAVTMLLSLGIGYLFRPGNKQTAEEYLMAGRAMRRFPVALSFVVSKLSTISLISDTTDIYLYGTQRCLQYFVAIIGSFITAFFYLPKYYSSGSATVYGYLDKRFGKKTRVFTSVCAYVQTLLYLSAVVYAPALALDSVTGISATVSLLVVGVVCILFSFIGGLKGVMWVDVFQFFIMVAFLSITLGFLTTDAGGINQVYRNAIDTGRLDLFDFSFDLSSRYTFWSSLSVGLQWGMAGIAVNQTQIQRLLAIKKLRNGQSALLWSIIPLLLIGFLGTTAGLAMYGAYRQCNPLSPQSESGLTKADQLVPYYLVNRFSQYPGLTGLCVSGLLCGSLTTLSSALNSLSTMVVEDYFKPWFLGKRDIDRTSYFLAKGMVLVHGVVVIALTFLAASFDSLLQSAHVVNACVMSPMLGLFTLGVVTRTANEKGVLCGLFFGIAVSAWIGFGGSLGGIRYPTKPFPDDMCTTLLPNETLYVTTSVYGDMWKNTIQTTDVYKEFRNSTSQVLPPRSFFSHRISFAWTGFAGFVSSLCVGYLASVIINFCWKTRAKPGMTYSVQDEFHNLKGLEEHNIPLRETKVNA